MSETRRGGWRAINKSRYMRIRIGKGQRETVALSGCKTDAEADARCEIIADVAEELIAAGRADRVRAAAADLGAATSASEIAVIRKAAVHVAKTAAAPSKAITFADFAKKWTSGDLARLYPDRVRKIDHVKNAQRLEKYINPHVGPLPLVRFTLDDAERVMSHLPGERSAAVRRHVAQIMHRVFALAVFPGRVIAVNPLPKGFLPRLPKPAAAPYLYPDEDAKLLRCKEIPLERRLAYGILAREGLRSSELLGSDYSNGSEPIDPASWDAVDLRLGAFNCDENKTDDPRTWALDKGVVGALRAWFKVCGEPAPSKPIFPTAPWPNMAKKLRADLDLAGVKRPDLLERSESRTWMKAHHLRGTFVTLSLANGKTETWVQDRTGHTSSEMINRYRRIARTAAELRLGELTPLDRAIPELSGRGGAKVGQDAKAGGANRRSK